MNRTVLIGTGPQVAYLSARDLHYDWARERWKTMVPSFRTCESVLSQAVFLLQRQALPVDSLFAYSFMAWSMNSIANWN